MRGRTHRSEGCEVVVGGLVVVVEGLLGVCGCVEGGAIDIAGVVDSSAIASPTLKKESTLSLSLCMSSIS